MKSTIAIIVVWITIAIFNFGAMNAQIKHEDATVWASLHRSQRDEIGFIVGETCVVPPVEFITTLFITNFMQYGWSLKTWGPQ